MTPAMWAIVGITALGLFMAAGVLLSQIGEGQKSRGDRNRHAGTAA